MSCLAKQLVASQGGPSYNSSMELTLDTVSNVRRTKSLRTLVDWKILKQIHKYQEHGVYWRGMKRDRHVA